MASHTGPGTGAHRAPRRRRLSVRTAAVAVAVVGLIGLGLGVGIGLLVATRATAPRAAPTTLVATPAVGGPSETSVPSARHATLLGEVVRVDSGDEVVVRVDGQELVVAIVGLRAPRPAGAQRTTGECGAADALRFADRTLGGRTVTLVPDPTLPDRDDSGRLQAHVVLPSQLSYTDAALLAGVAAADTSRPLTYAPVFAREQAEAAAAGRGVWGAPCRAVPGRALPPDR